jgi:hypothetical protein
MLTQLTQTTSKTAVSNVHKTQIKSSFLPQKTRADHILFAGTESERLSIRQKFQQAKRTFNEKLRHFLESFLARTLPIFNKQPVNALKQSQYKKDAKMAETLQRIEESRRSQYYYDDLAAHEEFSKSLPKPALSTNIPLSTEAELQQLLRESRLTADEDLARRLDQEINPASRTSNSSRTIISSNQQVRPLSIQALFGNDLKSITFKQGSTSTCYLLSALDNIFQHPQGQKILDLIKIKKIGQDYEVQFPGQPRPITVYHDELGRYVESTTPGVAILEQAYLKIREAEAPSTSDTTNNALVRMFGANRVHLPSTEETNLETSAQMQPLVREYADIWTATTRGRTTGGHYYSVRLNPENPQQIRVVNPYDTEEMVENISHAKFQEDYWPELNRIRLSD